MPTRHGRLNPQRRAMARQEVESADLRELQHQQMQQEQQQQFMPGIERVLEDRLAAIQKIYEEKARNMESTFNQRLADIQKAHEQRVSNMERLIMQKFAKVHPGQAGGIQHVSAEKARFESELRKVELQLARVTPNGKTFEDHIPQSDLEWTWTAVDITSHCFKLQKRCLQVQLMELTRESTTITIFVDLVMDGRKASEVDPHIRHSPLTIKIDRTRTMNDLRAAIERDLQPLRASSCEDNYWNGDYKVVWLGTEFLAYGSGTERFQYDTLLQHGIVDGSIATAKIMPGTPTWPW